MMQVTEGISNDIKEQNEDQAKVDMRRELRRKKILENAKNRLEKLNGRNNIGDQENRPEKKAEVVEQYSDPEIELNEIVNVNNTASSILTSNYDNLLLNLVDQTLNPLVKQNTFFKWKLHILLAFIISCGIQCGLTGGEGYSIFISTGTCIILEMFYNKEENAVNPTISLIAAFAGVHPQKANTIFNTFFYAQKLVNDLCLTIFLVCSAAYLTKFINENHVLITY